MTHLEATNGKSSTTRHLNGASSKATPTVKSETTPGPGDNSDSSDDTLPTEKLNMRVENGKVTPHSVGGNSLKNQTPAVGYV